MEILLILLINPLIQVETRLTMYKFFMEVSTAADDDSTTPVLRTKANEIQRLCLSLEPIRSMELQVKFVVGAGSYATGQVTFSIASSVMKNVFSGVYVYDIEYYAENQAQTITSNKANLG